MTTTFALLLAATLFAQPVDKPAENAADKPADSSVDNSADSSVDNAADSSVDKPDDKSHKKPDDKSDIVKGLVEGGHKRVAVIPAVLTQYSDSDQPTTAGPLGPLSKSYTGELRDYLAASSDEGKKYEVIPPRSIVGWMRSRGFGPEDLNNRVKLRQISEDLNADALVVVKQEVPSVFGDDRPTKVELYSETIDPSDNRRTRPLKLVDDLTLSKAAFQGQSWELRRWNGDRLESVGIDLPDPEPFGVGPAWEKKQYVSLRSGPMHPQLVPDCPYRVSIEVNGKPRAPQPLNSRPGAPLLVELNEGEVYRVILENRSQKPALCALYIDGANSIDKVVVEPSQLGIGQHWRLAPLGKYNVVGFCTVDADGYQHYAEFTIARRQEAVAQGASFEPNIGMITAIFYTDGMDGIEPVPERLTPRGPDALPRAAFGTVGGRRGEAQLKMVHARRGLMLAAMTFYYRSGEQVASLLDGEGSQSDPLAHLTAYVPPAVGDDSPPTPSPSDGTQSADRAEEYQLEP